MEVAAISVGSLIIYKGDMCNASGEGAVVAVNELSGGGKMFSMDLKAGKLVPIDSSKSFDIALDDGRMMRSVFINNIGGEFYDKSCRFMLVDGFASAEKVAELIAGVAMKQAADKAKADEEAAAFAAAKEAAKAEGLALGLIPEADFKGRGSAAASNLRAELKKAGIKARVKQDGYSAINVYVADEDKIKGAKAIGDKYEDGYFDGMQDMHV